MLTEFGYLLAWGVYLLSALALYWSLGVIFKRLGPKAVQYFCRSIVAVLLFTPAVSVPQQNLWAPAYLVSVYSYIQDEMYLATQAALFMAGAWCVIGLLLALAYVFSKLRQHNEAVSLPSQRGNRDSNHSRGKVKPAANANSMNTSQGDVIYNDMINEDTSNADTSNVDTSPAKMAARQKPRLSPTLND